MGRLWEVSTKTVSQGKDFASLMGHFPLAAFTVQSWPSKQRTQDCVRASVKTIERSIQKF